MVELLRNNVKMLVFKVGQISVFMKNPNNNSVNYCKSLFLKMAGP